MNIQRRAREDGDSSEDVVNHVGLVKGMREIAGRDTISKGALKARLQQYAATREAKWNLDDTAESWAEQTATKIPRGCRHRRPTLQTLGGKKLLKILALKDQAATTALLRIRRAGY